MMRSSGFGAALWAVVFAAFISGCPLATNTIEPGTDPETTLTPGLLGSWDNPVKCSGPFGEREYLDRLRGPDALPVLYRRLGNAGVGVNGHIVDVYLVESRDGSLRKEVFMDMYYEGYRETNAVEGFLMADKML
jgi:hypothetical protein